MGSGGFRLNAGRSGWHVKAEHCRQLDVRRWHRDGLLKPGTVSGWAWNNRETGKRLASIGFAAAEDHVSLSFAIDGAPMRQHVPLERTRCHYGGTRPWFQCPRCAGRVAVLFLRASGFACRHCQRVAYGSQSDDECGRAWRRQSKLEARLGDNWQRPKGMHHRTHLRLIEAIAACQQQRDGALAALVARRWPRLLAG